MPIGFQGPSQKDADNDVVSDAIDICANTQQRNSWMLGCSKIPK